MKSGDPEAPKLSLSVTYSSTDVVEKSSKIENEQARLSPGLVSSCVGIMVPYFIHTLPVISDISVNCVFLYRLGKHRVGGAVVN